MNVNDREYLSLLKIVGMVKHIIIRHKKYPNGEMGSVLKAIEEELNTYESIRRVADQGTGASKEVGQ